MAGDRVETGQMEELGGPADHRVKERKFHSTARQGENRYKMRFKGHRKTTLGRAAILRSFSYGNET